MKKISHRRKDLIEARNKYWNEETEISSVDVTQPQQKYKDLAPVPKKEI